MILIRSVNKYRQRHFDNQLILFLFTFQQLINRAAAILIVFAFNMAAVCVAIIGKDVRCAVGYYSVKLLSNLFFQNSPQYIATSDVDHELDLQYKVHAALDVVEEKCNAGGKGVDANRDLYLGLLYSSETHKMLVPEVVPEE